MPATLSEKVWNRHVVHGHRGRDAPLHRPPPRPRGDQPPGLRGPPPDRPEGPPARADLRDPRPQHPDRRPARHQGRPLAPPGRGPPRQLPRVRHPALRRRQRPSGDRPRRRPRAGRHPARPDDRLRRQPHQHPRRLRGAGLRHRHQRGRARPGDPDPLAGPTAEVLRHRGHRPAGPRPGAEGHHPGDHPADRHRRRHREHLRVLRPGDLGPLDGGPDDDLQHVDRGRRPRRHDRPRRHHLRVHQPRGPPLRPEGRRLRRGRPGVAVAPDRRPRPPSTSDRRSTPTPWPRRSPGGRTPG